MKYAPSLAGEPLPESAQRVADLLKDLGHDSPVVLLPETGNTSAAAAQGLGCSVAEIAKSIVFRRLADDVAVMVIASGVNRIDENKVAAMVGPIGKANPKFVKARTGYTIGGVCPIGHSEKNVLLIDESIMTLPAVWAAAGHHHAVFKLTPQQLVAMTNAPVANIIQQVQAV